MMTLWKLFFIWFKIQQLSFTILAADPDSWELIILHNNDMHARFEETDALSKMCAQEDANVHKCYGGFPRVSHVLKEYRNGSTPVLYLNAGDTYTGTPWFSLYKDKIVSDFMNLLRPDAICLGNHEFDKNIEGLIPFLNDAKYPIVTTNLDLSKTPELASIPSLKNSTIIRIHDTDIGIVGYLTPYTKNITIPNDLGITDEVPAINAECAKLRAKGVKIIIALGHSGIKMDKQIALECKEVDVVIGGHDNTFLWNGSKPDLEDPYGPYPIVITQPNGKRVPVVQAYAFTKYLGRLTLTINSKGSITNFTGQPILLTGDIPHDPEVLALLETYRSGVNEFTKQIIGVSKAFLNGTCKTSECNLGNFITDSYVYSYVSRYRGPDWTDASIAFMQGGGIRASGPTGNISMADLMTIIPFEDELVKIQMTGVELLHALEHSVHRYSYITKRGEFLQMSGLRVTYNLSEPSGERVSSVHVLCTDCIVPQYVPLEKFKIYKIILPQFLSMGGDSYNIFTRSDAKYVGFNDLTAVREHVQQLKTIYPPLDGRIQFVGHLSGEDDDSMGITVFASHGIIMLSLIINIFLII